MWLWVTTTEETVREETQGHRLPEVDLSSLGLSPELQRRLERWASQFMKEAPIWEWTSSAEKLSFRTEGFRLAAD